MGELAGWLAGLGLALDLVALVASALATWFWYLASNAHIHRVTFNETFDYHDLNRVIVAINRNSARNRRAALASALTAMLLTVDLLVSRLAG